MLGLIARRSEKFAVLILSALAAMLYRVFQSQPGHDRIEYMVFSLRIRLAVYVAPILTDAHLRLDVKDPADSAMEASGSLANLSGVLA